MEFCSLASGSTGNSLFVRAGKSSILVDAGYSGKKIEDLLKLAGIDPRSLTAILVTHEHGDHIAGVGVLSRRFRLPVYANQKTWQAMAKRLGKLPADRRRIFQNDQAFSLEGMEIQPLSTHHDAVDPVGFIFRSEGEKISLLADTGFVDEGMLSALAGSDIYYLEANHEESLLAMGPYPPDLKKRIASKLGHLSNRQSGQALAKLLEGRGERVLLGHLSLQNNSKRTCLATVLSILQEAGLENGRQVFVDVAPAYQPTAIFSAADIRQAQALGLEP